MKLESRDGEGQRSLNTSVNESEKQIERQKDGFGMEKPGWGSKIFEGRETEKQESGGEMERCVRQRARKVVY